MEESLVSIIIPAYNERERIAEALRSARRQSYQRLETIVVANGCTDDTAKVARGFADYVIEIETQGISNAKNLGAGNANGQVYAFMDADSEMQGDLIEKVYEHICGGYTGGKAKIRPLDDGRLRARIFCWCSEALSRTTSIIPAMDSGAGAFVFSTRELFEVIEKEYGEGFRTDLRVMEDADLLKKIKKHGRYKFLTESCLYTSMRRFKEEGYLRSFLVDSLHVMRPEGKTRERWFKQQ